MASHLAQARPFTFCSLHSFFLHDIYTLFIFRTSMSFLVLERPLLGVRSRLTHCNGSSRGSLLTPFSHNHATGRSRRALKTEASMSPASFLGQHVSSSLPSRSIRVGGPNATSFQRGRKRGALVVKAMFENFASGAIRVGAVLVPVVLAVVQRCC